MKERIADQALIFAIYTPGDDPTWLGQESVIGRIQGQSLFLLKDASVNITPGMLGDHEYIEFGSWRIEETFIRILEGLREIGYFAPVDGEKRWSNTT